jgi:hypothetical protein
LRGKADVIVIENADQGVVIGLRADRVVLQRCAAAEIDTFMVEFNSLDTTGANLLQKFRIILLTDKSTTIITIKTSIFLVKSFTTVTALQHDSLDCV